MRFRLSTLGALGVVAAVMVLHSGWVEDSREVAYTTVTVPGFSAYPKDAGRMSEVPVWNVVEEQKIRVPLAEFRAAKLIVWKGESARQINVFYNARHNTLLLDSQAYKAYLQSFPFFDSGWKEGLGLRLVDQPNRLLLAFVETEGLSGKYHVWRFAHVAPYEVTKQLKETDRDALARASKKYVGVEGNV